MKKNLFYFLLAALCTVSFTACSSDDNGDGENGGFTELEHEWSLEPTVMEDASVNVTTNPDELATATGSVKVTWDCPEGTSLKLGEGEDAMEMPVASIKQLVENLGNTQLPNVLKSVEFKSNGQIVAVYKDAATTSIANDGWKTASDYATYKKVNNNKILVFLNTAKVTEGMEADEKAALTEVLKIFKDGIPVNIRWSANNTKAYFYIDKAFVTSLLDNQTLKAMLDSLANTDAETNSIVTMIKAIINSAKDVMNKTTKFEAGLELMQ